MTSSAAGARRVPGAGQRRCGDQEPVADLGVEDGDADAAGGEHVAVGLAPAEIAVGDAWLHICVLCSLTQRAALREGSDVSDSNYRKGPEAISRLTPEQYRVTQQNG